MKDIEIKKWKDFPKEGVTFIDINNIIQDPMLMAEIVYRMTTVVERHIPNNTIIVSPESRAHFFSTLVAHKTRCPLINLRKSGKYPKTESEEIKYKTEYSEESIYAPKYDYENVESIYIIDDVCATGQSYQGIKEYFKSKCPKATIKYITAIDIEYLHEPIMDHTSILKISDPEQTVYKS